MANHCFFQINYVILKNIQLLISTNAKSWRGRLKIAETSVSSHSDFLKQAVHPDLHLDFLCFLPNRCPLGAWAYRPIPLSLANFVINDNISLYQTEIHAKAKVKTCFYSCWPHSSCHIKSHHNGNCLQALISRSNDCLHLQPNRSIYWLPSSRHCSTTAKSSSNGHSSAHKRQPHEEKEKLLSASTPHGSASVLQPSINVEKCETPETLLDFINTQINQNSLFDHQISAVADQYKKLVFASLSFSYLSENFNFRMKQLEFTSSILEKVRRLTSGPKWEHFMFFIISRLNTLPKGDQAALLNCLSSLFVSRDSEICNILLDNCLTNIDVLTLREIVLVTDVCCKFQDNFEIKGPLLDVIHTVLSHSPVDEIDLFNLCWALVNVSPILGEETLKLLSKIVKRRIELDSSSVTPGILIMTYQLLNTHGLLYLHDLGLSSLNGMMKEEMCLNDLPVMGLSLATSSEHPWPLSHLLEKVTESCKANLECCQSRNLKHVTFNKLSYCLQSINTELLYKVIAEVDIFLLVQVILVEKKKREIAFVCMIV